MIQTRQCLKLLGAGTIISLIVLMARELIVTGRSRTFTYYLPYFSSQPTIGSASNDSVTLDVALTGPTSVTTKAPTKTTLSVLYPKLYTALRPVSGPVNFSAAVNAAAAATGARACQRPKSESMILYLHENLTAKSPSDAPAQGGFWAPRSCWPPLSRTAVIVPYRNRSENLDTFVPYIHRLLSRQNILFGLFIVEQADSRLFNRAKLLNIGFLLSQRFYNFDCFVFHDADKVPENVANVYDCTNAPKLLISQMRSQDSSKYNNGKLYYNFFGGVTAITKDAYLKTNGNSNHYYGWGREDDELAARLSVSGFHIRYSSGADNRYVNLQHGNDIVGNKMPWPYSHKVRQTMTSDGLNTLNYTGLRMFLHPLFVLIRAEV